MRITHIAIDNVRGIESLEIKPGSLTVVSGQNGAGKSSVLAAIQAVFEGGHDASLIRNGAKKAQVLITLADGTLLKRIITQKSSELVVTTKDGDTKKAPAKYVAELAQGIALDPISLLAAKPKDRAAFLMTHSNITFQPDELQKAVGEAAKIDEAMSLESVNTLRKSLYEMRTGHNARAKEANEMASGLRKSLPEESGEDYAAELVKVDSDLLDRSNELARVGAEGNQEFGFAQAEIEAECAAKARDLERLRDEQLRDLAINYQSQKEMITRDLSAAVNQLAQRKSELKIKAAEQGRTIHVKKQIESAVDRYRSADQSSDKITKAIEKLDVLKANKLAESGIDGIEVVDGDIHVGGVPFDALNTAKRYQVAFMLASRAAGELPLMICDRAESFDEAAWAEFCEAAKESGMQIVAARVDDVPLTVEVAA